MNDGDETRRLPELSDEDVEILYDVSRRARESQDPIFKALYGAYDHVREHLRLDNDRDGDIYSYVMRLGEAATATRSQGKPVNLVEELRMLLESVGITFLEPSEEVEEEETGPVTIPSPRKRHSRGQKRRVSFDDAKFQETWLSEHSENINPPAAPPGLLGVPAQRGREKAVGSERHARSTSAQQPPSRQAAPKSMQKDSPLADDTSELDEVDQFNPTLYFEPSQTQLEQNAEAFLSTSALRSARQALHVLHDHAIRLQAERSQAHSIATAHDRRTLLKQALDLWRLALASRIEQRSKEAKMQRYLKRAQIHRDQHLVAKAFDQWAQQCKHEELRHKVAKCHMLKVTYFQRWRRIASENQAKMRRILVRKYIAVWREKTARRAVWEQQAEAHYEERLMKRCKTAWFWHFCDQRVEGWHDQWMKRDAFRRLVERWRTAQEQRRQATEIYDSHVFQKTLSALRYRYDGWRHDDYSSRQHYDHVLASKSLSSLQTKAKLEPIARSFALQRNANTERKALSIWRHNLALSRQANEVDRNRILQNAWTRWNDALRCKALAQRIDERVVVETLYRWILQERMRLFERTINGRCLNRALGWWRSKVAAERDQLADAEVVFKERQRRRRMAFGMLKLNVAVRAREDAERSAIEFANSRALPKVLDTWKAQTSRTRTLAKWAADARFYCLCSGTLKVWKERTNEHKANRRREVYVQVRAKVKIRLVSQCLTKWRGACTSVRSMKDEAERRAQARVIEIGTNAFTHWRAQSQRYAQFDMQATELDQQKLLSSALAAMTLRVADLREKDEQAEQFRQQIDLSLQAGALRRLQWATFTVSRKVESAEALWTRNRDQHIKRMLRHWAAQTATRRVAASEAAEVTEIHDEEPESPSLRPASRAASRSALADTTLPSSPPQGPAGATPSYLRTPSRPKRAGRFRPLPSPAAVTPMAFDSGLLVTTPAPLPSTQPITGEQSFEALTPQVTPFPRKLRAGGFPSAAPNASALRSSVFRRSVQTGTAKSVRFAGSGRFGRRNDGEG